MSLTCESKKFNTCPLQVERNHCNLQFCLMKAFVFLLCWNNPLSSTVNWWLSGLNPIQGSNWRAQSKNDPLIFRPFLKVFRSSWQLLLNTFKNGWKIKGSFLLWAFQLIIGHHKKIRKEKKNLITPSTFHIMLHESLLVLWYCTRATLLFAKLASMLACWLREESEEFQCIT